MKTNFKIYTLLVFIGMISTSISAQEIINVTAIPHDALQHKKLNDIITIDGKVIVPIHGADNEVYQYLPNVEVDSFYSPFIHGTPNSTKRSTLYAEYEPYVGFVDKELINLTYEPNISTNGKYILCTKTEKVMGINNKMLYEYPIHPDSVVTLKSIIAVFDTDLDTFVYVNVFSEVRNFKLKSDIEGDYIYVNIPLTDEDEDDLIFMGDTLTYPEVSYGNDCNYLVKINFKTGQKEWIRHIGYGDVRQLMIDDDNRINVEMVGASPLVYEFERVNEDELLIYNSWYDEVIFRINLNGEYIEKTRIYTFGGSDIYEIEFNSDGSFQAFGMVTVPKYIRVDVDSLDFLDATSFYEGKGLILVFDEHLDYRWGKKIKSDSITLVTAVNRSPNGDYVVSSMCECHELTIDGQTYQAEPPFHNNGFIRRASLFRFDSDGGLRGTPLVGGKNGAIVDIQAFKDDHYLILYSLLGPLFGSFDFLGQTFTGYTFDNFIIEYKGDLFDLMTTVDEYFDINDIGVSPNPVKSGGDLAIDISIDLTEETKIQLFDSQGQQVDSNILTNNVYRVPSNLKEGIYYLRLANNNESKSITIFIK
jgi:hypothetical protein